MTEADIIEQLVEFQNVLLFGVSIFVTLVSAYLVALYAFLDEAGFALKAFACAFLTLVVIFLGMFFYGASQFQMGLVDALAVIEPELSPAGKSALANARTGIDDWIRYAMTGVGIAFYFALVVLTFWMGWRKRSHVRGADGNWG
ncbi:MAG: hypothetical protein Q8R02_21295 [Hyphomonadaceae bacterium]|nr:hypothetical protein [Hyphomonadaceae bacterium]